MKITIKDINGMPFDTRLKFLTDYEKDIIGMKKANIKFCDNVAFNPIPVKIVDAIKADQIVENDIDKLHVKVVANVANYIDSQLDMLLMDSWKKSITERVDLIWHMKNHGHDTDSKVGEVTSIYGQMIDLTALGFKKPGQTQALIFETDILKDYDEKTFYLYKNKGIKNHSIALHYINIAIASNNKHNAPQYKNWEKYYPMAINPEVADENGYFFIVKEERILENSCVWRGASDITPTLETEEISNSSEDLPQKDAQITIIEPSKKTLNYEYLIKNL